MTAAYVLAAEPAKANGKYTTAFVNYEVMLRHFIGSKYVAPNTLPVDCPRTRWSLFLRNQ